MFKVLRGGCNTRHPSSFFASRPQGNPNWLILIVKTPAQFILSGTSHEIEPTTVIVLSPNTSYFYQNPNGEYIDDWLHFEFDNSGDFDISTVLRPNEFIKVNDADTYSTYIRQLLFENTYTDPSIRDNNVDLLMELLMNHLSIAYSGRQSTKFSNLYTPALRSIRLELQGTIYNPRSADEYAQSLGISKTYFQHLYKEVFGIPFQQDIIDMRMKTARDLLETTDMSIENIIEVCGYSNDIHFFRQFKALNEITPAKYRKKYRNDMGL